MSELLLHDNLRNSHPGDEVRNVVRVQTVTVIHQLDAIRNRHVFQFLRESGLISKADPVVNLSRADLTHTKLQGVDLSEVDLLIQC